MGGETRAGDFYFPISSVGAGEVVEPMARRTHGYYRDRLSQHIRLHRQLAGAITGQFRCNIPQASGSATDLYINIGKYNIQHEFTYIM